MTEQSPKYKHLITLPNSEKYSTHSLSLPAPSAFLILIAFPAFPAISVFPALPVPHSLPNLLISSQLSQPSHSFPALPAFSFLTSSPSPRSLPSLPSPPILLPQRLNLYLLISKLFVSLPLYNIHRL